MPAEGQEFEPSPEAKRANHEATGCGYRHGGLCHDGKGKLYKVRYDFWIAPDNSAIAIVGSGTIANMPINGASLYSCLADGSVLSTTNSVGDQDISGVELQQTWPGFGFKELAEKHGQRLLDAKVEPFPSETPMAGYFNIRKRKAAALVERRYAYYLDDDQTAWRYNLLGSVAFYFICTWIRPIRRSLRSIGLVRA